MPNLEYDKGAGYCLEEVSGMIVRGWGAGAVFCVGHFAKKLLSLCVR